MVPYSLKRPFKFLLVSSFAAPWTARDRSIASTSCFSKVLLCFYAGSIACCTFFVLCILVLFLSQLGPFLDLFPRQQWSHFGFEQLKGLQEPEITQLKYHSRCRYLGHRRSPKISENTEKIVEVKVRNKIKH